MRAEEGRFLIDAGGLALSKDRSTGAGPVDYGFGLVVGMDGRRLGVVGTAYQEHGVVVADAGVAVRVGEMVRVLPNHTCMTAAAHERYFVVDGGDQVMEVWGRVNGW